MSRTRSIVTILAMLASLLVAIVPAAGQGGGGIQSAGPLALIHTTADLNCAVNHVDDERGEFYGDTACGTFAALNGTLYGPASIPAGSALGSYTAHTPVDQTGGGTGSVSDPYRITTTVALGSTGVRITQVDTYVAGQAAFRTDITLTNDGSTAVGGQLYRAADCYLANSDSGYGTSGTDGRVGCTNQTRSMEFVPITGGSTFLEAGYSEVWAAVATQQPLPNTTRATELIDNGMALAWPVTVVGGGSRTTVSTSTAFGTGAAAGAQVDIVTSSVRPSTDSQGRPTFGINVHSTSDLQISIRPTVAEGCTITEVVMTHNGLSYPMTDPDGDGVYTGTIPRAQMAESDITYTVHDDCGNRQVGSIGRIVFFDPSGLITDSVSGQPVVGATVTLHHVPGWTAQTPTITGPQTCETVDTRGQDGWTQPAPTGEGVVEPTGAGTFTPDVNPQATGPDGRYGWDVVTGCWYVTVAADGYADLVSPVVGVPPEVTDLDLQLTPTGGGGGTIGDGVVRLAGLERIATAVAISQDVWDPGTASAVLVARHDNYPDSLAGGPLAVAMGGPLLLTPSDGLWPTTAAEIQRVLPAGGGVVLLGGVAALSEDVARDLMDLGFGVFRADGATRYETSVTVARNTVEAPVTIFVADGNTFGDALIASAAAPAAGGTVVLTDGTLLPDPVADYLDVNLDAEWVTVGAAARAALPQATNISGVDIYDTSRLMAEAFHPTPTAVAVASGENFPDALSGSAHSGRLGIPLVLSPQAGLSGSVQTWMAAHAPFSAAFLYGGTVALSDVVATQVAGFTG